MSKYINAKWHYPKMGEYPIKYGKYMQENYPQIPCLILYNGMYGVRFWNCTEECWDDEECDDFFCDKEAVEKWLYIDALDSLQQEQPEVDIEKEYTEFVVSVPVYSKLVNDIVGKSIARHFYELGLNAKEDKQ